MKEGQKPWTTEELMLTLNLYSKLTFGKLHHRNKDVIHLAELIGRTPSSVAFKLVNFAHLDPVLQARGIKGASNVSKLDKAIWNEYFQHTDEVPYESERLLAKLEHTTVEKIFNIPEDELPKEGKTRERLVKGRVNQALFRTFILTSYDNTCCITGIKQPEFLVAGHIKPWSVNEKNRLNYHNGIAINALHDKAFETGLLTITPDFRIKISSVLKKQAKLQTIQDYFLRYDNQPINLPSRFLPGIEFLQYHNEKFKL